MNVDTSGTIPTPDRLAIRVTEPCLAARDAIAQCPTITMSRAITYETPHAAINLADEQNNAPPALFFAKDTSHARESAWREKKQRFYKGFQWVVLLLLFIGFALFFTFEQYLFSPLLMIVWGGIMLILVVAAMIGWIEWYLH